MGLDDLVQPKNSPDFNTAVPGFDLADEVLKRSPGEILGTASVRCQSDGGRNGFHRRKMLEVPFVADHPGHADDAVTLGRLERVEQRRRGIRLAAARGGESVQKCPGETMTVVPAPLPRTGTCRK